MIAAPVELSTELPAKVFDDMLRQAAPRLHAQLNADSTAQLHWARRPRLGSLEVDVDVVGTTLWVRPRALLTGPKRWKLPERTPAQAVPLPDLPHGLLVTEVDLGAESLHISGLLPEWRMDLPLRNLEDLHQPVEPGRAQLRLAVAVQDRLQNRLMSPPPVTMAPMLDLILPLECGGCGAPATRWCDACTTDLSVAADQPHVVNPRIDPQVPVFALGRYAGAPAGRSSR